jgi:uncharacterized protein with PIN domain
MDFSSTKHIVARKRHKCDYCGFHIEKGETYSHSKGMYDGNFYDAKYCLRCAEISFWMERTGNLDQEEQRGFGEDFLDYGFIRCPNCGDSLGGLELEHTEKDKAVYECSKCSGKGEIDISLEVIMQKLDTAT